MMLLDPFIGAGIVNGLLLAAVAGLAFRGDRRWGWLAAILFLSAVVVGAILVQHRTEGMAERIAVAAEQAAWPIGPLFYLFLLSATGRPAARRAAAAHLALPILVLCGWTPLIVLFGAEPIAPWVLVAYQAGYTAAAGTAFLRRPRPGDRTMLGFWWPLGLIAVFCGVHLGQAARLGPWHDAMPDAVPVAGAAAITLILFAALALSSLFPAVRYRKSAMGRAEAKRLFDATRAMLAERGLFRRPDLSLREVAGALRVPAHHLSQALSEGGETSFAELPAALRVDDAKARLAAPENAAVAIEPIGMEAGFRSRSTFYAIFRRHTGLTPAEFRARAIFLS